MLLGKYNDGEYKYYRVMDEEFNLQKFLNEYGDVPSENIITSITVFETRVTSTPEIEETPSETPNISLEQTTATQNNDEVLAQQLIEYTWYGVFKQENDGKQIYKADQNPDYYEFYSDSLFIYQYADGEETLYGTWDIENSKLNVIYENSDIGEVSWDIDIMSENENMFLTFYSLDEGQANAFWIYADSPLEN